VLLVDQEAVVLVVLVLDIITRVQRRHSILLQEHKVTQVVLVVTPQAVEVEQVVLADLELDQILAPADLDIPGPITELVMAPVVILDQVRLLSH
jgi:hypothetical protein